MTFFVFICLYALILLLGAMADQRFTKLEKRVKELELTIYGRSYEDEKE